MHFYLKRNTYSSIAFSSCSYQSKRRQQKITGNIDFTEFLLFKNKQKRERKNPCPYLKLQKNKSKDPKAFVQFSVQVMMAFFKPFRLLLLLGSHLTTYAMNVVEIKVQPSKFLLLFINIQ